MSSLDWVNLAEWARLLGVHPQTAYRWFRDRSLLVAAVRVNQRTVFVNPDAGTAALCGVACMRGCCRKISV